MEEKQDQLIYPVGIDDLLICMMVEQDSSTGVPKYATKVWRLPVVTKLGIKGNGSVKAKYASNKLFARVGRETEHELSLEYVSLPISVFDEMSGVTHDEGVSFSTTNVKEMPTFALGYIGPLSDGSQGCTWYPRVQLSNAEELEFESTNDDSEIKDLKLTMTASGLRNNAVLYSQFNPLRASVENLTLEKFISTVVYDNTVIEELTKP
ncbi:major tail protein [Listeria monocytogenes]|uniref:major tail protein n=1 Tax=Listeria monocytogenes TaxID=1639 RepID=UPI000873A308|nr:major tail protein [Listeria monocytogenes]EAE1299624.1 phage tail protein [Listeria monocytogenes]EAE7767455.1 phage tail protein [Listeria monocytogenes]EAV9810760.1 phage tail protein [Listeria monocytogenes]EBF5108490.1 phage tail protein [Listeria monocytogenes]EKZ0905696.1 phage tail protein [Listeria monocytogenes]